MVYLKFTTGRDGAVPTKKPRVTITFEQDDYEMLHELSLLNGESLSSIVSGLVSASSPVIKRLILTGKAFQRASAERQQDVLQLLVDAESKIYPHALEIQQELLDVMDLAAGEPATDDPRRVTRGSRPPLPTDPTPENGRSS